MSDAPPRWFPWLLRFGLAFALLNALWTFENRWPGFGVRSMPRLSFELCLAVVALMGWVRWRGRPSARASTALALGFVCLVGVRYADVTAPSVLGRPVNLHWDGRHAAELLHLATQTLPAWPLWALALPLGAVLLVALVRRAIEGLAQCLAWGPPRPWLLATVAAFTLSFAACVPGERDTRWFFSLPLTPTLLRQGELLARVAWPASAKAVLGAGPAFEGDLSGLVGPQGPADVLLVFAESYGMVSFDRPEQAAGLAAARAALDEAIHAGGRTVGWMPGLKRPWPEGAFYGFDRLAKDADLGYTGPDFGYWRIPDQAALALLRTQELAPEPDRAPRFVVFPTTSTHAPFHPLAPFVPGGSRVSEPQAHIPAQATPLAVREPLQLYLKILRYQHAWLADDLKQRSARPLVWVVVGDHQPPALVSGPAVSWDVPVHVISEDRALLQRLLGSGFVPGLTPPEDALGPMHRLTEVLLAMFNAPGVQKSQGVEHVGAPASPRHPGS